ncbi:hypothetical protein BT63DRAFT_415513 [Microthyrium microscopicum]|uniref:Uncharacterized protein n=1 Tax=Microthyrium microscopicum TaxID=703497 RepID=A0A6A6U6W9_9PEZI|nr:hypothetical protein BT63DRAFT_415513 [Microthyrium microscopicum]
MERNDIRRVESYVNAILDERFSETSDPTRDAGNKAYTADPYVLHALITQDLNQDRDCSAEMSPWLLHFAAQNPPADEDVAAIVILFLRTLRERPFKLDVSYLRDVLVQHYHMDFRVVGNLQHDLQFKLQYHKPHCLHQEPHLSSSQRFNALSPYNYDITEAKLLRQFDVLLGLAGAIPQLTNAFHRGTYDGLDPQQWGINPWNSASFLAAQQFCRNSLLDLVNISNSEQFPNLPAVPMLPKGLSVDVYYQPQRNRTATPDANTLIATRWMIEHTRFCIIVAVCHMQARVLCCDTIVFLRYKAGIEIAQLSLSLLKEFLNALDKYAPIMFNGITHPHLVEHLRDPKADPSKLLRKLTNAMDAILALVVDVPFPLGRNNHRVYNRTSILHAVALTLQFVSLAIQSHLRKCGPLEFVCLAEPVRKVCLKGVGFSDPRIVVPEIFAETRGEFFVFGVPTSLSESESLELNDLETFNLWREEMQCNGVDGIP